MFNITKKSPYTFLQFDKDDFNYVLEPFNRKCVIHMTPKTGFLMSTERGLKLNVKINEIQITKLNIELRELIGIARHTKNDLFKYDFASLLIDSYHRFCIVREIMYNEDGCFLNNLLDAIHKKCTHVEHINILQQYLLDEEYDTDAIIYDVDGQQSNILLLQYFTRNTKDIFIEQVSKRYYQLQYQMYGQLYWKEMSSSRKKHNKLQIKKRKIVSNVKSELEAAYSILGEKQKTKGRILLINGKVICEDSDVKDLYRIAMDDYNDIFFQFMSSNGFYWSLVKQKGLEFFRDAFTNYGDKICGPLSLMNVNKINDNIFVLWVYIWTMSKLIKSQTQSGDISVPLQIDLVIMPNNIEKIDNNIGNISILERCKIHDQPFQYGFCDPTDILSIHVTLGNVLRKCAKHKHDDNRRIVIIVDRRTRDEYNKDSKHYDHIFAYQPPIKYAQIDKKHEILNAIWNTSKFIVPPWSTNYQYEELSGAQNNNLFVLSFLIRKKSQFIHLFEQEEVHINSDEDRFDGIESISSEDSESDLTNTIFNSKAAQDFVVMLHRHKELTILELVALFEKVADTIKTDQNQFKELQTIQAFIMKLLMNRKGESIVNTYLFYNKGYCRFEPLDLVRILPTFFNLKKINNYEKMLSSFQQYHDKLWSLDDLIWMEYNRLYLQSANAMNQQISTDKLGIDHQDIKQISEYCKWMKHKQTFAHVQFKKMDSDKIIKLYKLIRLRSQKSLDLFRIIKREKYKIEISSSIDLRTFLVLSHKNSSNGIKIKQIGKNGYGSLFKETGVKWGWFINAINEESTANISIGGFNSVMDEIIELKEAYTMRFVKIKQKKKYKVHKVHSKQISNLLPSRARKRLVKPKQENTIQIAATILNINVDLGELNEAYKLAKWIKSLPMYCKLYNKSKQVEDCKLLAEFMYQMQYCGKHLKYNFDERDFKDLVSAMHNDNSYNYDDYVWIWEKIMCAQSVTEHHSFNSSENQSLNWIVSEWKRFQIMEQRQYENETKNGNTNQ